MLGSAAALAADRPNILVIWGDDVGQSNISAYSKGMMGYQTPNIDRIAREGVLFTDYYGEQSGRALRRRGHSGHLLLEPETGCRALDIPLFQSKQTTGRPHETASP